MIEDLWPDVTVPGWEEPEGTVAIELTQETSLLARVSTWRRERAQAGLADADLVELGQTELLGLKRELEASVDQLSERDRVLASPSYLTLRAQIIEPFTEGTALRAELGAALPEVAPGGPLVELGATRMQLEDLRDQLAERLKSATWGVRLRHLHGLLRLHGQVVDTIRESTYLVRLRDLVSRPVYRAIVGEVCRVLKPHPAERAQLVELLRNGDVLATELATELGKVRHITWPSPIYADNPAGFIRDVLGQDPWDRQVEICETVRDGRRITIVAAQKVGKTFILAALALWWFATYRDGRVFLTNCTADQLDKQDWQEVQRSWRKSGRCLACTTEDPDGPRPCPHSQVLDGHLYERAIDGLKAGERGIFGKTARNVEAFAGYSGAHLLVIIDEASSTPEDLFQALVGNVGAKGAKVVMASNPTKQHGPHFDSFHRNSRLWKQVKITAHEAARANREGLVDQDQIDFIRESDERGTEGTFYQIRVEANWPKRAQSAVYALEDIFGSMDEQRYRDTPGQGRLIVTLDPAGEGGTGDESVWCVARGLKVLLLKAGRGWTKAQHLEMLLDLLRQYAEPWEAPIFGLDCDGVGAGIKHLCEAHLEIMAPKDRFELRECYFGQDAVDWQNYDQRRDEMHAALACWLSKGGALPYDARLEQELEVHQWVPVRRKRGDIYGKPREVEVLSATRKADLRKQIHRSPDRNESVMMMASVWRELMDLRAREGDGTTDRPLWMQGLDAPGAAGPLPEWAQGGSHGPQDPRSGASRMAKMGRSIMGGKGTR